MILGSFIIQFFLMSTLMTNKPVNIRSSLGKFYMSSVMAFTMGILEVIMYDYHMGSISIFYYLFLGLIITIFIYLYRYQVYIYDKEYLNEMIEHHSMALLTSEEILQKTQSERVKRLAENIISTQQAEIEYMNKLVNVV
jgi:tyrosine-protein phosphatase YwqE